MKHSILIGLIAAFMLNGCVTRCWEQTYFKPEIPRLNDNISAARTKEGIVFSIGSDAYVEIWECGSTYSLCIRVMPEEDVPVMFETTEVRYFDHENIELESDSIKSLNYSIYCRKSGNEKQCSSSVAVNKESELYRKSRIGSPGIEVYVSPTSTWKGATDSQHGYLVSGRNKLRRYETRVRFPGGIPYPGAEQKEVDAVLPAMIINGKKIVLPRIKFHKVTENICGTFA